MNNNIAKTGIKLKILCLNSNKRTFHFVDSEGYLRESAYNIDVTARFDNKAYDKTELQKANTLLTMVKEGRTVTPECSRCEVRFLCFTNKAGNND